MNTLDYVENLLKNYHDLKRQIEHFQDLTMLSKNESICETIQSLNFKDLSLQERGRSPWKGDPTGNIALVYEQINERINTIGQEQLKARIAALQFQVEVIDKTVAALQDEYREIIEGIYIKKISRRELCRRFFISENTLHRRRKKALAAMAELLYIIL